MDSVEDAAIGRRIRQARDDAGLTQAQLAAAVSLDRSALAKVETGTRKVSAVEVAAIAAHLGIRLEWLILEPPAAVGASRSARKPEAPFTAIDRWVERIAREIDFVRAHDVILASIAQPTALARPDAANDIEQTAAHVRRILGLDPGAPVDELSSHCETLGLFGFSLALGAEAPTGSMLAMGSCGIAVVNGSRPAEGRRLALAQQLGRYLMPHQPAGDHFARALLLPAPGIKAALRCLEQGGSLRQLAVTTATVFGVDPATVAARCRELALVSPEQADDIGQVRVTKADLIDFDLRVRDELAPPHLPRAYEAAVLRLYRDAIISAPRALDLLLGTWKEDELPELPMLPHEMIWAFVS